MVYISYLVLQKLKKNKISQFQRYTILQHYTLSDGIVTPTSQVCTITVFSELQTALQK
jgi:hypothetical protein